VPPAKPGTIKHAKLGGWSSGFQIKDADGKKWLVKLDSRGYPQLSSGADMVSRTLLHAAAYNVPHNEPVRFKRGDVTIDPDLLRGEKGELFTDADLGSALAQGAVHPDGSYLASASPFLPGHALGSPSMQRRRPGDSNDWYTHINRRELRVAAGTPGDGHPIGGKLPVGGLQTPGLQAAGTPARLPREDRPRRLPGC
jgi:hypothetical protein